MRWRSTSNLQVFDFDMIKKFVSRSDFSLVYDALWAITAAYAKPLFVDKLGCDESVLRHNEPKEVRTSSFALTL
jgi:phosphoglucomutase